MKKILVAVLIMMGMNALAQNTNYTISKDKEDGGLIFNGRITFDDLNKEQSFTWLKSGREEYKPSMSQMDYLKRYLNNYRMVVFLGTWCDDSHNLIPKFEKMITDLGYPQSQLTMYGVDREKTTQNGEHKTYAIKFVPTIILFQGDREAGRITESVNKSVEADIEAIIKKDRNSGTGGYR